MAVTAVLAMATAGPDARAQEADPAATAGEALFGTYALEARGVGIEAHYEIEGLLPGGAPVLDLAIPETLARFSSGPSGYGLASLAYPGGVVVNLSSLVDQSGGDGSQIPPYPIKAEAFFPSGPTEVDESQGGGQQKVVTDELGVEAAGSFPGVEAGPAVEVGTLVSSSRSAIEEGKAVSRTRVELGDVNILGGLITIESVVTDLVSAHDGSRGAADGGTRVTGVRFLGLAAAFTDEGLVLTDPPPVEGPAASVGGLLDPVTGPIRDGLTPVQEAIADVVEQATPRVDDLLAQAGVTVRVAEPEDLAVDSGAITRTSRGLSIELSYEGREQQQLTDLINSVPDELKPNLGPIPFPVAFLAENHITGLEIGPATVSALASPPFDIPPLPDVALPPTGSFDPGTGGELGAPSFATPVPQLPSTPSAPAGPLGDLGTPFDGALPALLVLGALVLSPLFGLASTRLADNVLAPVTNRCPTGQDTPSPARSM
jgi:hypothetical protein